jgi:hypothetical protein
MSVLSRRRRPDNALRRIRYAFSPTSEVWLRVVGVLVPILGHYYVQAALGGVPVTSEGDPETP